MKTLFKILLILSICIIFFNFNYSYSYNTSNISFEIRGKTYSYNYIYSNVKKIIYKRLNSFEEYDQKVKYKNSIVKRFNKYSIIYKKKGLENFHILFSELSKNISSIDILKQEKLEKIKDFIEKQREKLKQEKLKQEKTKQESFEQEKTKQEKLRQEKLQQEKLKEEKLSQEKLQQERIKQEKLRQEKLEQERIKQEKLRQEKLEQERINQEKLRQEKLEQERINQEKLRQEKLEQERINQERSSSNESYLDFLKSKNNLKFNYQDYEFKNSNYFKDDKYKEVEAKRKEFIEKYGINLVYGDQISYTVRNMGGAVSYDPKVLLKNISKFEKELEKYPKGMIKKMFDDGYGVSFGLIETLGQDPGYSSRELVGQFKLFVSGNDFFFGRTFHHELMHLFHYYIDYKNNFRGFPRWNSLNPENFSYGFDENSEYIYDLVKDNNLNSYFIGPYSTTNYLEDIAVTFSDMMFRSYPKSYHKNSPLRKKMQYIDEELIKAFGLPAGTKTHWNRLIK